MEENFAVQSAPKEGTLKKIMFWGTFWELVISIAIFGLTMILHTLNDLSAAFTYLMVVVPVSVALMAFAVINAFVALKNIFDRNLVRISTISILALFTNPYIVNVLLEQVRRFTVNFGNELLAVRNLASKSYLIIVLPVVLIAILWFQRKEVQKAGLLDTKKTWVFPLMLCLGLSAAYSYAATPVLRAIRASRVAEETLKQSDGISDITLTSLEGTPQKNDTYHVFSWKELPSGVIVDDPLVVVNLLRNINYKDQIRTSSSLGVCNVKFNHASQNYECHAHFTSEYHLETDRSLEEHIYKFFILNSKADLAARDAKRKENMNALAAAIRTFHDQQSRYPCMAGNTYYPYEVRLLCDNSSLDSWLSISYEQSKVYRDPLHMREDAASDYNFGDFGIMYRSDTNNFILATRLEGSFEDNNPDFYCIDNTGFGGLITKPPVLSQSEGTAGLRCGH
jgi:hypothetical protein